MSGKIFFIWEPSQQTCSVQHPQNPIPYPFSPSGSRRFVSIENIGIIPTIKTMLSQNHHSPIGLRSSWPRKRMPPIRRATTKTVATHLPVSTTKHPTSRINFVKIRTIRTASAAHLVARTIQEGATGNPGPEARFIFPPHTAISLFYKYNPSTARRVTQTSDSMLRRVTAPPPVQYPLLLHISTTELRSKDIKIILYSLYLRLNSSSFPDAFDSTYTPIDTVFGIHKTSSARLFPFREPPGQEKTRAAAITGIASAHPAGQRPAAPMVPFFPEKERRRGGPAGPPLRRYEIPCRLPGGSLHRPARLNGTQRPGSALSVVLE